MRKKQTVIGSYKTEDEVIKVIKRLIADGYLKDEITLFTNQKRMNSLDNPEDIDIAEPNMSDPKESHENDKNFWQSIKDAFKIREDHHFDDPNYTADNELLYRYRDNLIAGEIVIVVNNFNTDRSGHSNSTTSQERISDEFQGRADAASSMGSLTEIPSEGVVEGMTDGGQPPLEPEQSEGTPPELEDTHSQSDSDTVNKKRTKRSDDLL